MNIPPGEGLEQTGQSAYLQTTPVTWQAKLTHLPSIKDLYKVDLLTVDENIGLPGVGKNLTMVDSAYPTSYPSHDITLIYVGGDTPHPWTDTEIQSYATARYRWACWVRSNPIGGAQGTAEGITFAKWLQAHNVPKGTTHILDLETAVNTAYVLAFDISMMTYGYKVTKYGSLGSIWGNPKTSGGTFVANPTGSPHMVIQGDTVATQYAFLTNYDLSLVLPTVPLWDTQKPSGGPVNIGGHYTSSLSTCRLDDGTRLVAGLGTDGCVFVKQWTSAGGWREVRVTSTKALPPVVASNGGSDAQMWYADPAQAGNIIELNSSDSGLTWS